MVVAAILLEFDESQLNLLARTTTQQLAQLPKGNVNVGKFMEFLSQLRERRPEFKIQNPLLHS